jgi:hypothetical protein
MIKKIAISIISIAVLLIAAYVFYINPNHKSDSQPQKKVNSEQVNKLSEVHQSNSMKPLGVKLDDNTYDLTDMFIKPGDKVRFLNYDGKDRIYLATEDITENSSIKKINIKLYNINNGKVEKYISIEKKSRIYNFLPMGDNGFYIIEETDLSKNKKVFYHIYDSNLNLAKTMDLTNLEKKMHGGLPALSNNGDKIAYIDSGCIYISDLTLKNIQKVYEIGPNRINMLIGFSSISFMEGDKQLAFIGSIYKTDELLPRAFGAVNIDGSAPKYKEHDEISSKIQICKGKTFFLDANTERGKSSTGKVFLLDNIDNSINEYNMIDKNESQSAYISNEGNYIITSLSGKLQNGQKIYRFRIYETKSKKLLREFNTTALKGRYDEIGILGLQINEASNSFYVTYSNGKEQKIYMYKLK